MRGKVFEITDGDALHYRGSLYYDLVKISVIRLAYAMAEELRHHNVASIAVIPGFMCSEAVLDHYDVNESNWHDAIRKDRYFAYSETPHYHGRAIVALAVDHGTIFPGTSDLVAGTAVRFH